MSVFTNVPKSLSLASFKDTKSLAAKSKSYASSRYLCACKKDNALRLDTIMNLNM